MGFLADKKILITGVLSNRSIAYGVARACHREGAALAFTYVNDTLKDRVTKIAAEFGTVPVLPCDVTRDDQIDAVFAALKAQWGVLDACLSDRYVTREALSGDPGRDSRSRSRSRTTELLQLAALARGAAADAGRPDRATTYLGAAHVPNYNVMASQGEPRRAPYLATVSVPGIRVNGIAGRSGRSPPAGIGTSRADEPVREAAPLRRNVTIDEVGTSPLIFREIASAITARHLVGLRFSTIAAGMPGAMSAYG